MPAGCGAAASALASTEDGLMGGLTGTHKRLVDGRDWRANIRPPELCTPPPSDDGREFGGSRGRRSIGTGRCTPTATPQVSMRCHMCDATGVGPLTINPNDPDMAVCKQCIAEFRRGKQTPRMEAVSGRSAAAAPPTVKSEPRARRARRRHNHP